MRVPLQDTVLCALKSIGHAQEAAGLPDNFTRYGGSFDNGTFSVTGDSDQGGLFRYGDFTVEWYKYIGRSTNQSRERCAGRVLIH